MNIDSPFEQWRLKHMKGMAASREIMELLALAFEGGRVAEREACAKLCEEVGDKAKDNDGYTVGGYACAKEIRKRNEK